MNEIGTGPAQHPRKHLISPQAVARYAASASDTKVDLTRHHGQGNGLRTHALYFAIVSLVALLFLIVGVAFATTMM